MTTSRGPSTSPDVVLDAGNRRVDEMLFVPGYELIVTASHVSSEIRVFSRDTAGQPNRIFSQHEGVITGMVHVFEDVIASVDRTGRLITWEASTGNILSQLEGKLRGINDVAITQDNKVLYFNDDATLGVVTHSKGRNLEVVTRWKTNNNNNSFAVHGNICVYFERHHGRRASVWNSTTFDKLGELNISERICCITLNDETIVVASVDSELYVFANRPNYPLISQFKPHDTFSPMRLEFIQPDVLLCTESTNGITFVSITKKASLPIPNISAGKYLWSSCVLSTSSVCVGGKSGYCVIIQLPPQASILLETHWISRSALKEVLPSSRVPNIIKRLSQSVNRFVSYVPKKLVSASSSPGGIAVRAATEQLTELSVSEKTQVQDSPVVQDILDATPELTAVSETKQITEKPEVANLLTEKTSKSSSTVTENEEESSAENSSTALSKSGLSAEQRLTLADRARNEWKGWQINPVDIDFLRKGNGDRKLIDKGGTASVYLGVMKIRDEVDNIIPDQHVEVAVKAFVVHYSCAIDKLPQFMREMALQKGVQHECIVKTMGGYWPNPDEDEDEDDEFIEPWIVMERMSCNLQGAIEKGLLDTFEAKRRILRDVAEGLHYLHGQQIVHRDIKPENVLLQLDDGQISGRAKLCDLGVSRNAEDTLTTTIDVYTKPTGTSLYMAPECWTNSAQKGGRRSRDIWSFGVLMCVVFVPNFLKNIVSKHGIAVNERFGQKVADSVRNMAWTGRLRDIAVSCLSIDPKMRPRIGDVLKELTSRDDEA